MTIKQENLCLLAVEHARKVNNFADCDVIQEAIDQVKSSTSTIEALAALEYLNVAVCFRRPDTLIAQYKNEFKETITV